MSDLANCVLPGDLKYHIDFNVWLRDQGDGTFQLGMTDIAQTLAGSVIHCRPKKAGKTIKAGKSIATVESGKWVGPVKAPFHCEIVSRNEEVESDATVLNRSPYSKGWIVCIRPTEEAGDYQSELLSADAALEGFRAYMAKHDLAECSHCDGFEE